MSFKVGDKVVCFDATNQLRGGLIRGDFYTVTKIGQRGGIKIIGLPKYHWAWRFRKIQPTNALSKELAEDFIEQDSKVREQEVERVFSLTESF